MFVGSLAVAATVFLKQTPEPTQAQANQPNTAVCQTEFDRPLLFGVSPDDGDSGYDPNSGANIQKAGSTMARVPLNWDKIQPNDASDYDPDAVNSVNYQINKAYATGRVVVVNLSGTPPWATGNPELLSHEKHNSKAQPNKASAEVNREFRELVTQAVRDHKDKVKYWTYWNEPNGCMSSRGECGYDGDSLRDFAYWHHVFYETVKEIDPTAKIIFANVDITAPSNVSFIRDAHELEGEYEVQYDYLGLNVYRKTKNAEFPIEWVQAGYEAQPSSYRKPVWLNEWGFDRIWWGCPDDGGGECRAQARQEIAALIENGFNKIIAADYIFAAQYHNLRDEGGDYGLWDSDGPRPGGTMFLNIVNNRCNPVFSSGGTAEVPVPAPTEVGACVVASHDVGSDFLQRGTPITLTSVASQPVKTFKYAFYNSDNKKESGVANMVCVAGAPEVPGDDCPDGSGQLVFEVNGDNNLAGALQAESWLRLPNGQVLESIWRGDMGWNRRLMYDEGLGKTIAVDWNFSAFLGIETFGTFRSTAEIDTLDFLYNNKQKGAMEIWRNNIGERTVFEFNAAGDYPDWSTAQREEIANLNTNPDALPGSGVITAAGSFSLGSSWVQVYWRGTEEWVRSVAIQDDILSALREADKQPNRGFMRNRNSPHIPNTKVQAVNFMFMPGEPRVQERLWQNNQIYQRFIPVIGGEELDYQNATKYVELSAIDNITENSNLTDSLTLRYDQLRVVDVLTGEVPKNLQINATFVTEGGTIRDDGKCVMRFAFDETIDGDVDGNCVNDIYDYNLLMQYYNTDNCQYNIAGTNGCRIDMEDVTYLKERFGNRCE